MSRILKCTITSVVITLSLVGCSDDGASQQPTGQGASSSSMAATKSATPSPDPTAAEKVLIEKDLQRYMSFLVAGGKSTSPVFDYSSVATGETLAGLKASQNEQGTLGNRLEGTFGFETTAVTSVSGTVEKSKATVQGCLKEDTRLINSVNKVIQRNRESTLFQYELIKVSDKWLVFRAEGQNQAC